MSDQSLQEIHAPTNACFGCGPANEQGLRLRSFPTEDGESTVCEWTPERHHEAFPGVLSGGIIGTLLDCHSNWTACWHLMRRAGDESPPCTVTAEYAIKMRRPTPTEGPITLRARVVSSSEDRADVEATPRGGREGLRDLDRYLRGGQARASGLPPLVRRESPVNTPASRASGTHLGVRIL